MPHLSPEEFRALAVCSTFGFMALGCIIIALLDHQRKMAKILRSEAKQPGALDARVDALQQEIRELKSMVAGQIISNDDLKQRIS